MPTHKPNKVYTCLVGITLFSVAMMIVMFGQRQFASGDASTKASNNIIVTPMQLRNGMEVLCLVDPDNQTLSVYQYKLTGPEHERLALLASRSYKYDVMLEDFNTAAPNPKQVKEILENASYIQSTQQVQAVAEQKVKAIEDKATKASLMNEAALEVQE